MTSYLHLVNGTTHIVKIYYVRGGQWYPLVQEYIGIADERRVRLPAGARDGFGRILLAVEYMDGLLRADQRRGVAWMPFYVEPCTEVPVRITFPPGGTGQTGPPIDLCRDDPGYGPDGR